MRLFLLFTACIACWVLNAQPITFPVKASADKKYLVDKNEKPVFLRGSSSWRLPFDLTSKEIDDYLQDRTAKGFNTVLIHITPLLQEYEGMGGGLPKGVTAFYDNDISKPNEIFFKHLDTLLNKCLDKNIVVMLAPLYLGCCRDGWLEIIQRYTGSEKKCRDYGIWIANRYKEQPNLIWVGGGDHNAVPESIAFSEGIASVDSLHLHTFHAHPGKTSAERLQGKPWHTLSAAYTYFPALEMNKDWQYTHVYTMMYEETLSNYHLPCILIESAYEEERNTTTQMIRRQAWWALLGGASGHIYGHRDIYPFNAAWKKALNSAGAESMHIFHDFVKTIPWQQLKTDWPQTLFMNGRGTFNATILPGGDDYAIGSITKDSSLAVLYMPTYRAISVNMKRFRSPVTFTWFDPSNGSYFPVAGVFNNTGVKYIAPPKTYNNKGFDDWVLIVQQKK